MSAGDSLITISETRNVDRMHHIRCTLTPDELNTIDALEKIVYDQSIILFNKFPESADRYLLRTADDKRPSEAFINLYVGNINTDSFLKGIQPYKTNTLELHLVTNISTMKDLHNPCIDKICNMKYLRKQHIGGWLDYLYHAHKDRRFTVTEQKFIFNGYNHCDHENNITIPLRKTITLHYNIGRYSCARDFLEQGKILNEKEVREKGEVPVREGYFNMPILEAIRKTDSETVTLERSW